MSTHQDHLLQDLTKCTVAIENPDNGKVLGTGVIVTDDGLIVTCYHVLENIISNTKTVSIRFPTLVKTKMQADIVQESSNQSLDIAFLKLQTKQPDRMIAANLSEMVSSTHPFIGFGFKKAQEFDGLHVNGEIQGKAHKTSRDGTISPPLIQLQSHQIAPGMSGSAILDTESNKVIGIVSERYRTQDDAYKDLSFGIPVDSLAEVYPELRNKNYGLLKITNFLYKIGLESSKLYRWINELYVPPIQYSDIKSTLQRDRIIFITGAQEYGKSYTALRILWEYYKNDNKYKPKYIKNGAEADDILEKLKIIDERLNHQIIYFEDPFGKIKYESNKKFEENIGRIIDNLKIFEDTYIIITSREEVFKDFESHNTAGLDLTEYRKNLNIHSYNYEKRLEMLLNLAAACNCKWLYNNELKDTVTRSIEQINKLSTPLNIKDFVIASINETNKQELLEKLNAKSQETAKSFAEEVKEMTQNEILFFSFPFISEMFSLDFVRSKYQDLVNDLVNDRELDIRADDWEFDRILRRFLDSKIDIIKQITRRACIRLSHPSYYEALPFILTDKNSILTTINTKIFSKMLLKLGNSEPIDSDVAWAVADAIASNFDKLPENVQNLLFKLADDRYTAGSVAYIVIYYFDKLPEDVQNLLFKLADDKDTAYSLAFAIGNNFDNLPSNVRNELLLKLAGHMEAFAGVAFAIGNNFDNLPKDIRERLLTKLVDDKSAASYVADAIASNFDKLSEDIQNLLFKLADKEETAEDVAYAIGNNFDNLPEDVRNLIFKLADDKEGAEYVAGVLDDNFDKLPEDVRNTLLLKVADSKKAASSVADAIAYNFDKLPQNIQNLIFKLADDKNQDVADAIAQNLDKLPEDVRNTLLLKVADSKKAASSVARTIVNNFDKLPQNIQNLIFKLADDKEAAYGIAYGITDKFDKLPENVRNILFKLADSKKAAKYVADAVSHNFDKLPEDVRNTLLLKLVKNKKAANSVADVIEYNFDKLPENVRNELLRTLKKNKRKNARK